MTVIILNRRADEILSFRFENNLFHLHMLPLLLNYRQCTSEGTKVKFCSTGDIAASPPIFVSLEELMKAANDVTNMVLAHEIALNKDFKFQQTRRPNNRYAVIIFENG